MQQHYRSLALAAGLLAAVHVPGTALAQKPGGILRLYMIDSPASMSIHEEATVVATRPMMGVFNNLVLYDQHVKQNRPDTIVPDLATSWSWNEEGTELTFALREGVRWHDGKPFTANDVRCTWDMLTGKSSEKFRINPRKSWYRNLDEVVANGDYEVSFRLKRPQPAFLALLAGGLSPVYPCHVSPAQMRQQPIGTGPFKFVEFKPNEAIRVKRNPDYWKPGLPYLDGIEYTITKNRSTAILAFVAGKYDLTFAGTLTIPLTKDLMKQVPQAICEMNPGSVNTNLIVNRDKPPFDNPQLRRAMSLSLDRQAFIDILTEGMSDIGGAMQSPPGGLWGMPRDVLVTLPGYDPDVAKNRAEARQIMQRLGYGPDKRLKIKVSARDIPPYRDPAVILLDQLKEIYVDAELEPIDTTSWFPKVIRRDFTVGLNLTPNFADDPDPVLYTSFVCGAEQNYNGYCDPVTDKLIEQQSMETDREKRKRLVWEIERKLAEDGARPIIYYNRGGICWQPYVKGLTVMVNSIYNGWRMEDIWLDQ
ncbi:MAG TPA: ABC transporter substrate-binding protein [Stellaceae bacterium]|nr:ABC transporter substrate-binding protein [Stellaceae bacterium]